MNKNAKIYVAGHGGMVGSAMVRKLQAEGYQHIVVRTSNELDLTAHWRYGRQCVDSLRLVVF